jgi:hypothetical protein
MPQKDSAEKAVRDIRLGQPLGERNHLDSASWSDTVRFQSRSY